MVSHSMSMPKLDAQPRQGVCVRVRGRVQGVGFRPTVWRLARDCGLDGEVLNDAEGVLIRAWGQLGALEHFLRRLQAEPPPLARIDAIEREPLAEAAPGPGFAIAASRTGEARTDIAADAATCPDCLAEVLDPTDRRHRYPFANCTHCGPRLTIVRGVPYDRARTSMAEFVLCGRCRREYDDPADRRFHAQPNACPDCGPQLWLQGLGGPDAPPTVAAGRDPAIAIDAARARLLRGDIIAIKGLGGFHLACDATDERAVQRLRERKGRYHKPFALMARDLDMVRRYCECNAQAAALLAEPAAPIVILPVDTRAAIADAVAPGQRTLGFMLPYTPLHHLLLRGLDRPIVLTSGNASDEPQCTDDAEARRRLAGIADRLLGHDRPIVNRVDDSVVRIMAGAPRVLRRARGYAPGPLPLPPGFEGHPALLALGGELKNTFCLLRDGQAILSQHLGDLEDAATFAQYREALPLYGALFGHAAEGLVIDPHPEYLSTKLGRERAQTEGLALHEVQHHHAHVAACLAENGRPRSAEPVLGVALDGLGFGADASLWGGEFLRADYRDCTRLAALAPVPMPGGERAVHEPWRNTYAHIDRALGWRLYRAAFPRLELTRFLEHRPLTTLDDMLAKGLNSPPASSCGRLFDAVAAAIGLCRESVSHEGQAAIELEARVDETALHTDAGYPFELLPQPNGPRRLEPAPMWRALLADLSRGVPRGAIAARFHRGLAQAIGRTVRQLHRDEGPAAFDTVALSGGVFQNRILLEQVLEDLAPTGLRVLTHSRTPANDGGLSLGQAAIAAARAMPATHSTE